MHDKKKHLLIVHNFCKGEMDSLVEKAFGGTGLVNSLVEFGSIGGVDNVVDSTSGPMADGDKDISFEKEIDKEIEKETCMNDLLREKGSAVTLGGIECHTSVKEVDVSGRDMIEKQGQDEKVQMATHHGGQSLLEGEERNLHNNANTDGEENSADKMSSEDNISTVKNIKCTEEEKQEDEAGQCKSSRAEDVDDDADANSEQNLVDKRASKDYPKTTANTEGKERETLEDDDDSDSEKIAPAFEDPAIGTKSIYKEILLQGGNKESYYSAVKTKHKEPKVEDQAKTGEEKSPSKHLKEFRSLLSAVFHDKEDSNSAVFYEKENLNPQQTSCNLVSELEEAPNSYSTAKARLAAKAKRSPPSPKRQITTDGEKEVEEPPKSSPKKKLKTTRTEEMINKGADELHKEKTYVCTMCPKEWSSRNDSRIIHTHLLPVHFKSEFEIEIKAVFSQNMCSFCGAEVLNKSKKISHLYSKHNTFKDEVKKVAKAITSGNMSEEASNVRIEKNTYNNETMEDSTKKKEEAPSDVDEDKEVEAELIQASLMMLQDISDSEDDE